MNAALRAAVEHSLGAAGAGEWRHVGATGWGDAWSLTFGAGRAFVKVATGRHAAMLECEADGLVAIAATRTLRVPKVLTRGAAGATAYVALEWLDLRVGEPGEALGRSLAALHRAPPPCGPQQERFGWHRDNWIGGTPQHNAWSADWCSFFRDARLAPQIAWAFDQGFGSTLADCGRVLAALPELLRGHAPQPALVHGDLWSGNAAMLASGEPVVFDPAVYVGDREVDVAMMELFGGFDRACLPAYQRAWPVADGYPVRRDIYNLYHLLNHVNLFGAGYLARTQRALARVIAAVERGASQRG